MSIIGPYAWTLRWLIFLLGQQGGYTRYPCFLCYWDSRASTQRRIKKDWPGQEDLAVGDKNLINEPLVSRDRTAHKVGSDEAICEGSG